LESLLLLESLPGVGLRGLRALVEEAGTAQAVLREPALLASRGGRACVAAARDPEFQAAARRAVDDAERLGMETIGFSDPGYPAKLLQLADPPPVLFLRGRAELLTSSGVTLVGARKATARARDVARRLGAAVARTGTPVVSGLALGIDGAAHLGALDVGGPTVAVLGRGADRAYPSSHARLFRRIVETGLVVSEFPPFTPALPHHFPRRNRILAALCSALVVVEAGARSGALISVDHALDLGVDVWAVPGPIEEPACAGSNLMLADGARPLVSVDAFVSALFGAADAPIPVRGEPEGPSGHLLAALAGGGRSVDELARMTGLEPARVLALCTALELDGRVSRLPGARYRQAG
jgi:DNA processing protein